MSDSMGAQGTIKCDARVLKANGQFEEDPPPVASLHLRPCRHGMMIFFPHDFYIGGALERYGEYAEEESKFMLERINLGDVVVEVGANIGCHTVPIARKVGNNGRVLAFEPQRILFQMMCGNVAVNGLWNVIAEHMALGDTPSVLHVPPIDYTKEGNFGGVSLTTNPGEPVQVMPLDAYKLSKCDFLKIDVEGMELSVLKGAAETIKAHRPRIYCENDRQEKAEELVHYIMSIGYMPYWHLPKLYSPENFKGNAINDYANTVSVNMLCLPIEKNLPPPNLTPVMIETRDADGMLQ